MADPVLGLPELIQGDASAYIRQNNRNLVLSRLAAPLLVEADPTTTFPSSSNEGDMYVVGAAAIGGLWAAAVEHDLAIALSDTPQLADGWVFITPVKGMIIHNGTNAKMWNGTAWTTMVIT